MAASRAMLMESLTRMLRSSNNTLANRTITTNSGALVSQPMKYYKFVLFRLTAIVVPFTYVGYWAGGQFAEFLEEHEFYIPDEDEDD